MYACLDLGSNSFHLLIGRWREGRIEIVERLSEKVQLGEDVGANGRISQAAFQRGMDCLGRFKRLMGSYPLESYWALGTNTFRVSDNAEAFLEGAAGLGIRISVISGVQEAMLIYAGVITSLPESDARRLVIDVGGGSTEVIVGRGHERGITESLAIGSVAWRDRFLGGRQGLSSRSGLPAHSNPSARSGLSAGSGLSTTSRKLSAAMDEGKAAAAAVFEKTAAGFRRFGWDEVYASSGTMKMLAYICREHGYGDDAGPMSIHLDGLRALKERMVESIATGAELPGLKESRRDLLLAGWCVISGLMETYRINRIRFSPTALREGMLDFIARNGKAADALRHSGLPDVSPI